MTKDEAMKMALDTLSESKRSHYYCEDRFYSCPKHEEGCANDFDGDECNCGADTVNKSIDAAIEALRTALAQPDEQIDIKGAEMNTNRSGNLHEVMHQAAWDSATRVPEGDIRALKHRIHELEGEVIGYKQILDTQPEPEPVAWYYAGNKVEPKSVALDCDLDDAQKANCMPLYTAPLQRKPLTDEKIDALVLPISEEGNFRDFVRAIEAAHGIG